MRDGGPLDTDDERQGRREDRLRPLSARRVAVRFLTLALALVAVDLAVGSMLPKADYADDWRMPRTMPTSQLTPFVRYIDSAAASGAKGGEGAPIVSFVGASPTWGDAVRNSHRTVPAWYRRSAETSGTSIRVFNLASNGQLLGDEYFVARRVASDSDVVLVQITYHGFNKRWRENARQRYPELARLLGEPVDPGLAAVLGIEPTRGLDVTGGIDRWLQSSWRLYGARDELAARFLGKQPEASLFERWQKLIAPDFMGEVDAVPSGQPFNSLEPDEQMLIADEFSSAGDYRLDPTDSEVKVLERLADDLARSKTKVVFYVSPVNVEALRSFDLYDAERYRANIEPLRRIVTARGHRFIDLNTEASIPSSAFADINHTTASGSRLVAHELWTRTSDLLEAKP